MSAGPTETVEDLETALIGAAVQGLAPVKALLNAGLRPHHFQRPMYGQAWGAVTSLANNGVAIELPLVISELGLPDGDPRRAKLYEAIGVAALASTTLDYATRVITAARLRHAGQAGQQIAQLAAAAGPDAVSAIADIAERVLPAEDAPTFLSIDKRVQDLWDHAERVPERLMSYPFWQVDELVELAPAEVVLIGGVHSHGKSILNDTILEHVVDHTEGATACLYLSESRELSRDLRAVSRATGIPYERVKKGARPGGLTAKDKPEFARGVNLVGNRAIRMERIGGRSAEELAREIRRNRPTVCSIDLLNGIGGRGESLRERVENNIKVFASCAQETGTVIFVVNHMTTKTRMGTEDYPAVPTVFDFRESTQLPDLANNALLIYVEPEEYTDSEGRIRHRRSKKARLIVGKSKEGETGEMDLVADFEHMRLRPPIAPGTVGALAA